MTKMYWQNDVKTQELKTKRVAVLGYGSQGRAHALNLKESGLDVVVGVRPGGKSWKQAEADGWKPFSMEEAVVGADVVALLLPDMVQAEVYEKYVRPHGKENGTLLFAHGLNIHFDYFTPNENWDVVMVAPKSPGALVRRQYEEGKGVPALFAVHNDKSGNARNTALEYAHGIGCTRAGVLETTFAEETVTDLFGEQAVLCGGATELVQKGFETLVEAGYQPELAYFEVLHELKLIVDLLFEGGFEKLHEYVSETAIYGDLTRGPRVVDNGTKVRMKEILHEIQSGQFAREWKEEYQAGLPNYNRLMSEDLAHPMEEVGKKLRANMSWIQGNEEKSDERSNVPG